MARAATTKRRISPSTATRKARRMGPSRRGSSRGGSAPRATRGSVLASGGRRRGGGLVRRLVRGLLLLRLRLRVAVGGRRGLLGALLAAVVRGVEARALEGDADRLEDLADRGAALDARGQDRKSTRLNSSHAK